jgi:hypothetical protein
LIGANLLGVITTLKMKSRRKEDGKKAVEGTWGHELAARY